MSPRDPFAAWRERLDALGFRPRRQLGQNFLLQPELHRVIADAGEIGPDDVVLEIGAGLGFLTSEVARRAARVVAVEIDPRLFALLEEHRAQFDPDGRVRLVRGDALERGALAPGVRAALAEADGGRALRVVANLPYAITGPTFAALCTGDPLPAGIAVLVQKEAAERLAAEPNTPEWGSLSALVQACYRVRIVRRVGREVFRPRPNVDSAVIAARRRADGMAVEPASERASFAAFLRALFSARRKKLRHRWEAAAAAAGGAGAPDDPAVLEVRPGELSADRLVALWRQARRTS